VRLPELVPEAGAIAAASPSCAHPLASVLVQEAPLRHPKSVAGAGGDTATGPPYLRPRNLLLGALMRLPKLVSGAGAIAAACPFCANPLAGVLLQRDPLRHPKSVAKSEGNAATGPPYLRPSNLLRGALVRLPELVPGAGAIAAACPSCAHPLAEVMVQEAPLRHPKSVAGAGGDTATGPPYLRPRNLLLGALMRLPKLVSGAGAIAAACPFCANPLAGVLLQRDPLRHPKSVAKSEGNAATGHPYLRPSNLL